MNQVSNQQFTSSRLQATRLFSHPPSSNFQVADDYSDPQESNHQKEALMDQPDSSI